MHGQTGPPSITKLHPSSDSDWPLGHTQRAPRRGQPLLQSPGHRSAQGILVLMELVVWEGGTLGWTMV